jgi:hypothetical protein
MWQRLTSLKSVVGEEAPSLAQAPPWTRATSLPVPTPTPLMPPCFRTNLGPVLPGMWAGRQGGRAVHSAAPVFIRHTLFLRLLARQDSSGGGVAARMPVCLLGALQGHVLGGLVLGFLEQLLEER